MPAESRRYDAGMHATVAPKVLKHRVHVITGSGCSTIDRVLAPHASHSQAESES